MTAGTKKSDEWISESDLFNEYLDQQHEVEASQAMKDLMMKRYLADATMCAMECELKQNALPTPTPLSSPKSIKSQSGNESIKFNTIATCLDHERITGPFIPIPYVQTPKKKPSKRGIFSQLKKGKAIQLKSALPREEFDEDLIFQLEKKPSSTMFEPILNCHTQASTSPKRNTNIDSNSDTDDQIPIYEDKMSIGSEGTISCDLNESFSSSLSSCIFGF